MSSWQIALSHGLKLLIMIVLWGVLRRRSYRLCWAFPVYLIVIFICNLLISIWPERFFNRQSWVICQGLFDLAKFAIALEITARVFQAFPGARSLARIVTMGILVLTTCALVGLQTPLAARDSASFFVIVGQWQPRIVSGTIWLMTSTALMVVWYRLPIRAFQRDILLGFTPYLLVFSSLFNVLRQHGWDFRERLNLWDGIAYMLLLAWWAFAAWRASEELAISPEVARRLNLSA
jgi:hypothetical protein